MRILLKGFVADGTNEPARRSVLIENDTIIAVEKEISGSCAAEKIFQFRDEIIAPGFIDVHGHSDLSLAAFPGGESKRSQGVTTEITGNCGLSAFPVTSMNRDHLNDLYADYGISISWDDLTEYRQMLVSREVKLRTYALCGHNTLRASVAGYEKQELSIEELMRMQEYLERALKDGSPGLSTGLLYTPGCFANPEEITSLMRVLTKYNAVYATHLRSEGDHLTESLTETLECAKKAGLKKVEISHFKTAGENNWHKIDQAFEIIHAYRDQGIDVRFDRYPYTESQTMLSMILPAPFDTMPDRDITIAFRDDNAVKLAISSLKKRPESDWSRWRLTGTTHPYWHKFAGQKYHNLPGDRIMAVIDQLKFDATTATIGAAGMSENNLLRIITDPLCMPGSDGNAVRGKTPSGTPHPRAFGAIARFFRMKLDAGETIGNVVASATSKPADFFNLPDIGTLHCGKKADITVFSPEEINSDADFTDPYRPAAGIRLSMLDGELRFF